VTRRWKDARATGHSHETRIATPLVRLGLLARRDDATVVGPRCGTWLAAFAGRRPEGVRTRTGEEAAVPQASARIRLERLERRVEELTGLREAVVRMEWQFSQFREEMRIAVSALDATIRAGDEETRRVLREEILRGDDDSRRYMRVLYEDLIDRLKTLREGGPLAG
jgi:hypothetical protein